MAIIFGKTLKHMVGALALGLALTSSAVARSITINVDSSLAEYLIGMVCSHKPVNAEALKANPALQSQIKHHSNLSETRSFGAFLAGLEAASACTVPAQDPYAFGDLVRERKKFESAVSFFKSKQAEIESFVRESLSAYAPKDLNYEGNLVLSVVGNKCGGFSMDGQFFLALNCLRGTYESEEETAKLIAAHEIFHDMQYEFFFPFEEDMARVKTLDDAFDYLFMNLTLEGTAEFVADSRNVTGNGMLSDYLRRTTQGANHQIPYLIRLFGYSAEMLKDDGKLKQRVKDLYSLGFGGNNGQLFYYVGAAMARHIEATYGREALVCIMAKPPEQFMRAYNAAAVNTSGEATPPLGDAMMTAANRLSDTRTDDQLYEMCIQ
ncbi:DUF5700 domain-containing putative Zn-dependent protease [Kordiimonas aestuarii]|uniref:DUF5700 domain-containing putative Zn-dependent protease n=1 Tax=Kordiimonas aestuarii TaxID=1005925 RepID=UPI0021CF1F59|nr:DUF5700 domain-containing putative Zn-dependent protease [Kordiimonas aestuarii]